ncbi:hypothetical protein [Tenacibaculum sp. MAR_2009_124]|uniref:hypothetical protein n=1 Tax=Tenacibaculum sp. MAR_2009_124 TaxID=1250059 RepID=UPI00115FC3DA|nr:hypothetical protein [Tenacibaculum sp. MAR_2009_124]
MTKGIKVQIDSGLDIKKGYKLRSLAKITEGSYKFTYLVLQREQTSKNFNLGKYAGIVIIADSEESGRRYYRAIPFQLLDWDNKDPLTNLFRNDVQEWDKYMSQAFAISSTRVLASLMNVYGKVLYENNVN